VRRPLACWQVRDISVPHVDRGQPSEQARTGMHSFGSKQETKRVPDVSMGKQYCVFAFTLDSLRSVRASRLSLGCPALVTRSMELCWLSS